MPSGAEDRRPPLQRVPPHDLTAERHVLGAAMLRAEAAQVVADLDPQVFYWPGHQIIADTTRRLVTESAVVDPGTIAAQLRADGQLDAVRSPKGDVVGATYLVSLQASTPNTSATPKLASLLVEHWHKRQVLSLASEVVEAVYGGVDTSGLVARMHEAAQAQLVDRQSSWDVVNLAQTLAGDGERLEPTILARTDGHHLLYPGRIHALNAESESGKSWVALLACIQQMRLGHHTLYIDFEDSPESVVERALAIGASPELLLDRFHYIRPDDPIDEGARVRITEAVEAWPITIAVIDGVTEAMLLGGWSLYDNVDIARFLAALPRLLERAGVAVLLIDHVTKDKDSRGRFAIGGQHKLAGITGASYSLDVIKPFGRGLHGIARLTVTKDKHGQIRAVAAAGGRHMGEFHLDATGGAVTAELHPPTAYNPDEFRPTFLMEKISRYLELNPGGQNLTAIRTAVTGKNEHKDQALQILIAEGYVAAERGIRNSTAHTSIRPFRAHEPDTDEPATEEVPEF